MGERERAPCRLACEIRNYRDDSEQLGSSTGREWCMLQRRQRDRAREGGSSKENGTVSRSKCMRTRGDNTNARRAPLFLSPPLPAPFLSRHLSLLLFFIFSPIRINVLEPRLEVNSRVHLRSTRWIIQRTLTVLRAAERNGADAPCKSFQEDEASSVCPRTISAEHASSLDTANLVVRSCLRMIAGIPFANSDRGRWWHSVGGHCHRV